MNVELTGAFTTKFSCVALTFWKLPEGAVPVVVTNEPVVVGPKPVPVRATIVLTGAPTASAVGAAEVMTGPATLKAPGNVVVAVVFSKTAP